MARKRKQKIRSKKWYKLYDDNIELKENFKSKKKYEDYITKLEKTTIIDPKDIIGSFNKFKEKGF